MTNSAFGGPADEYVDKQKHLPSLSPLYKIATEAEPSPLKEHTKVISKFLETYKIGSTKNHHSRQNSNSSKNEKELFERLERELSSIV